MLNLLPITEKKFLKQEQQKRLFAILCFEFFNFLVCVLLVMSAIAFFVLGEVASENYLSQQVQSENGSSEFMNYKYIILDYNKKMALVDSFYTNQANLSDAIDVLLSVKRPEGLYFNKLSLQANQQTGKTEIIVSGVSDDREGLLTFKNNIEAERKMQNINFSPESWISQKNINFNLTLDIKTP